MKKIFRQLLALSLVVCIVLPLASCALFGKDKNKQKAPFSMSADNQASCRVIYPAGDDASTWRGLANEFIKALRRITGVIADIAPDTEAESENEILIGATNRALSAKATEALDSAQTAFSFTVEDGKFAVCASNASAMKLAIAYFEMQYDGALGGTLDDSSLSFPGDLALSKTVSAAATDPADLLSGAIALEFHTNGAYDVAANGSCNTLSASAVRADVLYVALSDGNGTVKIAKKNLSDGKLLQTSDALALGNAVSMCYNPVLDLFAVVHESGDKQISLVDPETLTVRRTVTAGVAVDAIAYDTGNNRYAAKVSGENRIVFFDNTCAFTDGDGLAGVDPAVLSTGTVTFRDMSADSRFVYLLYSADTAQQESRTVVVMMDYTGTQCYVTDFDLSGKTPLSLTSSGRVFYVASAETEGGIAAFHRVSMSTQAGLDEPSSLFNEKNTADVDTSYLSTERLFYVYAFIKNNYARNTVMQGACTDGTYGYFFMEYQGGSGNYSNSETHDTVIVKVDMSTGNMVAHSEPLKLGHSNDGCYNPRTNQLIVAYNGNNKSLIKFIDPQTLTVTGEKNLPVNIFSIAYNNYTGQYVVGLSGGRNFAVLDADFNVLARYDAGKQGPEEIFSYTLGTDLLTQGIDCDSQYVYFVLSGQKSGQSVWTDYLLAFDYNGNHQFTKVLPGLTLEIENIFHIGTDIYVTCNGGNAPCYKISVSGLTGA